MSTRIPIIVLGGSDQQPSAIPKGLSQQQMLQGFKGALQLANGRCLVDELIERINASECFGEPLLVGPREVYETLEINAPIVNAEGNLAITLQRTAEIVAERFAPEDPIALTTCDILPTAADFRRLIEEGYSPNRDAVFWTQLVHATPARMGASAWKPAYQLRPRKDSPPLPFYPGHLVIVRPAALRMDLTIYLLNLAYRYRNRELWQRRLRMIAHGLGRLILEDFREVFQMQPPVVTASLLYSTWRGYRDYRRKTATIREVEQAIATAFLRRPARQAAGPRPVVFHQTEVVSFAKDIDTLEELAEITPEPPEGPSTSIQDSSDD
jgi:hypothetical protein